MFLAGIHSPWKSRCKCPIEKFGGVFSSHRHVRVKTQGVYLTASPAECFFQGEVCDGIWWEEGAFRGNSSWIFLHQTWGWILGQPEVYALRPWSKDHVSFPHPKKRSPADLIDGSFIELFNLAPCFYKPKKIGGWVKKNTRLKSIRGKNSYTVGRDLCRWRKLQIPSFALAVFLGGKN